jgi:hypothetical protein
MKIEKNDFMKFYEIKKLLKKGKRQENEHGTIVENSLMPNLSNGLKM